MTTIRGIDGISNAPAPVVNGPARLRGFTLSKSGGRRVGTAFVYTMLSLGALVMAFPMFWMLTASFKPQWQIMTQPPIWIPSRWIQVQAGTTNQEFPVWHAPAPEGDGRWVEVIEAGTRRYTAVVMLSALTPEAEARLTAVPRAELSDATPTTIETDAGEVYLNVRRWTGPDGTTEDVVALGRDGDNLIIAPLEVLLPFTQEMPLDRVNAGRRETVSVGAFSFQVRSLEDAAGMLALGPETQLTVVAPKEVAAEALLVTPDSIARAELAPVGRTALQLYTLAGRPESERFVVLSTDTWQPILDFETTLTHGRTVLNSALTAAGTRDFNGAVMPMATTELDGVTTEVAVLIRTSARSFVLPVEYASGIELTPIRRLALPQVRAIDGVTVPFRDDYVDQGERRSVAIVGDRRDLALIAPQPALASAFDVPSGDLQRNLVPNLEVQNYIDALSKDLGGATFITFYRNSTILVLLNMIGHFLSVTIVAYGFARLRAPGKNILFLVLLSTMMLPYPVLLIPTYEIFNSMGMIDTLWPLFIRSFFGNAFLIFLLRQFFTAIPRELEEAARIDGAHLMQVLWHVMLPLSKPALATIGIFTFWWTWNSFFEPYVYLSSIQNFTVSLGLGFFKGQYTTSYHLLMAASVVATLPIIVIFFFAQRYFIEGIQLQGLKG